MFRSLAAKQKLHREESPAREKRRGKLVFAADVWQTRDGLARSTSTIASNKNKKTYKNLSQMAELDRSRADSVREMSRCDIFALFERPSGIVSTPA